MKINEFEEKYKIEDIMTSFLKYMGLDLIVFWFVIGNLFLAILLPLAELKFICLTIVGIIDIIILLSYLWYRKNVKRNYVKDYEFIDLRVHLEDGSIIYQTRIESTIDGENSRIINNEYELDWNIYLGEASIGVDILESNPKVKILTPFGDIIGKAVSIEAVYDGAKEIYGKIIPIFKIILTDAGVRSIL